MPVIDNDEAIRDRAYALWEKAGRPTGQEHVHWAEAKQQIEDELGVDSAPIVVLEPVEEPVPGQPAEIVQLRSALYAPEPFSFELFGGECPKIDLAILVRAA
ncbi:DUF2934 domain-containing protein [Aureimonas leprariae]|uniref:DUF2934 domain-containing protein n=1 Tax=Plantimonas leprariae TaxID=2615207 RepID=A0A7V7TXG4_9HYPH|nr:DUF2934 domain-containing protein [Aureimonas leprariae]KAB0680758.1 DUF2934 domain-containing protein [Aureimonas leprariae]